MDVTWEGGRQKDIGGVQGEGGRLCCQERFVVMQVENGSYVFFLTMDSMYRLLPPDIEVMGQDPSSWFKTKTAQRKCCVQ